MNQIKPFLFPEKIETWNFSTAIEATNKENIVKITRIALFALASLVTTAVLVLTDKMVIVWPVAGPLIVVMLIAWFVFFATSYLETTHTEGLDKEKRIQLAKDELKRLFFTEPLGNWNPEISFAMINTLLQTKIFNEEYIEKIKTFKNFPEKTLFQAAQDSNNVISFQVNADVFLRGLYGNESSLFKIEAQWDGNQENEIIIKFNP